MRSISKLRSLVLAILIFLSGVAGERVWAAEDTTNSQIDLAVVVVNGRRLSGPNSGARKQDGRILIPVAAAARALGDGLTLNAALRKLTIVRQDGVNAGFDAGVGIVTENGATVLSVSNTGQLIFPPNPDELFLPAEILSALLGASISFDVARNEVVIQRGLTGSGAAQTAMKRGAVELYHIDYQYDLNRYSASTAHGLVLRGAGRIADGRFLFSSSTTQTGRSTSIQNASFSFERPNGQRFIAGDVGTGGDLGFMNANVRGISVSTPIGGSTLTAFGGRTFSGLVLPQITDGVFAVRRTPKYDTNTFGAVIQSGLSRSLSVSGGFLKFSSENRNGTMATGGFRYGTSRARVEGDLAVGAFHGIDQTGSSVSGNTGAVDVAATYQLLDNLSVQGRFTSIGRAFLSPQSGVREPLDLKAAAVTWSPSNWLSTSVNVSTSRGPGDRNQNNDFATVAFAVTPRADAPKFYFSHTQGRTSLIRRSEFTTFNASKEFSRVRFYMNATRIKNIGPASVNANIGASVTLNDKNAIDLSQGFGSRRSTNGQFDWRSSGLFNGKFNMTVGAGYTHSPSSGFSPFQKLAAGLNLPRQTSVQLNYYNTPQGSALMVSVRGSLFRKREAQAFLGSPAGEMNSYGKISGRVYQDIDMNGRFDEGIDKPQADVKVRVDGNRYVVTDEKGVYLFESIEAGGHKVYVDLLSVRADLTLLNKAENEASLRAGHEFAYDFRLVRTGRVSGRVWFDANENGIFDEGEKPLSEVRVTTSGGRDTLTDADGNFTIADLPPGEQVLIIDEKTLPEKTVSGRRPIAVQVFAGRETSDVQLPAIAERAEVKVFGRP